jgi:NAD(P) transhydrogenase
MNAPTAFDLVVLGAGPAGVQAALAGALFGKSVALVERAQHIGGALVNTGTLPSKTLRETALALSGLQSRELYGVDLSLRREATLADFMYQEERVKSEERSREMINLQRENIHLYQGTASFADPHTIRITGSGESVLLRGEKILIATGSSPIRPPGFAFEDRRILDSNEILTMDRLPRALVVVGAGVIGSEYACTFAALGCSVTVVDGRDVLLPFIDGEVSRALVGAMESLGITFCWNEKVGTCEPLESGLVQLTCASGRHLVADHVLVAAGRRSNTEELNLGAVGISPGPKGLLAVDEQYRTRVVHIYAAGTLSDFRPWRRPAPNRPGSLFATCSTAMINRRWRGFCRQGFTPFPKWP